VYKSLNEERAVHREEDLSHSSNDYHMTSSDPKFTHTEELLCEVLF